LAATKRAEQRPRCIPPAGNSEKHQTDIPLTRNAPLLRHHPQTASEYLYRWCPCLRQLSTSVTQNFPKKPLPCSVISTVTPWPPSCLGIGTAERITRPEGIHQTRQPHGSKPSTPPISTRCLNSTRMLAQDVRP
jgi:hypothetical protein